MIRCYLILGLALSLIPSLAYAQAPAFSWQKCLGSPYLDLGASVTPTTDGGSISVGYVSGNGGDVTGFFGLEDYWAVKQDANGVIQWSVDLGGTYLDMGSAVREMPDGNYLIGGEAASVQGSGNVTTVNRGGLDAWLIKISPTGSIIWQKSYGGGMNEYVGDIKVLTDGRIIVVGSTQAGTSQIPGNHGNYDIWVMELASDGTMQWQKCIGGSQDDWGYGVSIAPEGFYVSGWTSSFDGDAAANHGSHDMMAAKLDPSGNLLWAIPLGGTGYDEGYGVAALPGGGAIFAGLTRSNDGQVAGNHGTAGWQDAWLVELDMNGGFVWQHCYGGSYNEAASCITPTQDGEYLVAGSAESLDGDVSCMPAHLATSGGMAGWVFKVDLHGALQWDKVISGDYFDYEQYVQEAPDKSILICGYTCLSDIPGYHHDVTGEVGDIYVGKLSPVTPSVSVASLPANICSETTITLTATYSGPNTGVSYHWFKNNIDQGVNSAAYSSAGFANGDDVYCEVYYTDGVCTAPQMVTSNHVVLSISTTFAPTIGITGPTATVCAGTPMLFNSTVTGGSGSGSYQWLVNSNPVSAGGTAATYSSTTLGNGDLVSCVYSDNTVCVVPGQIISNVIAAQVDPQVAVSIQIGTTTNVVCADATVDFSSVIAGGGNAPAYQWMINNRPASSGGQGASFSTGTLADGDVVSCMLVSSAACSSPNPAASNLYTMTVKPVLTAGITLGYPPATICSGKPVVFTAVATNAGLTPQYQWTVDGVPITGAGSGMPTFATNTLANGDIVSVEVSDAANCVVAADASVTVAVDPSPTVGGGGSVLLSKGESYTLDLPVTGDIASYSWHPGLWLTDSTAADPVATPLTSTEYTLTVATPEGCTASDSIQLKVFSKLAVPTAFSPNGDGHNDVFYVIGGPIGSKIGVFAVYDRWGQAVFAVHDAAPDDPAYGWNGNIDGRPAPGGVYVYILRMVFADGTQQVVKGTVILVR